MKTNKIVYQVAGIAGISLLAIFLAAAKPQEAATKTGQRPAKVQLVRSLDGADIFHAHCASCHGTDGTGSGPVAPALSTKVPDLTTIAKRNGGLFPTKRVQSIIAGDGAIAAHGSHDMPVWGPIFHQIESDRDFGHIRLRNVTKYIESIQQK